jgi:hypothetical protein
MEIATSSAETPIRVQAWARAAMDAVIDLLLAATLFDPGARGPAGT